MMVIHNVIGINEEIYQDEYIKIPLLCWSKDGQLVDWQIPLFSKFSQFLTSPKHILFQIQDNYLILDENYCIGFKFGWKNM